MLISENKLRRIIRQEIIKENKRLNENSTLINTSLALLMTVSSALGISPAQAEKSTNQPATSLSKCVQDLSSSPQRDAQIVRRTIELAREVDESGNEAAREVTLQTCKLVLANAGSLSKPGIKLTK